MFCKDCDCENGSCEVETPDLAKMKLALDTINQNREKGLRSLEDKVNKLLESEVLNVDKMGGNADLVATLRDLSMAANATFQAAEAEHHLVDMLISDLVNLATKLQSIEQSHFATGSHLQVLLQVLFMKEVVTEEELRNTWVQLQEQFRQQVPQE